MELKIEVTEREGWITATTENTKGALLGNVTAPVTEGATFDIRGAVIRASVEEALAELLADSRRGP